MIDFSKPSATRLPFLIFLLCMAAELLSFVGWYHPTVRLGAFGLLALGALALAFVDLRWAFAALAIEAVIGSHGRLFFGDVFGLSVSIRMALFAAVTLGWIVHVARGCSRILHFRHAHVSGPLLLLLAAVTLAVIRGWAEGAPLGQVIGDGNAYAFILLVPIALDLFADRAHFAWLVRVLSGALAWLAVKSLLLLYFFSHDFGTFTLDLFRWQRQFGLTEVTHLAAGAVRVFAASDLFLLPALFAGLFMAWQHRRRPVLAWTALMAAAFVLCLSRSFWLGAIVATAFMLPVFVRAEIVPLKDLGRLMLTGLAALGGGLLLLAATAFFPLPHTLQDASSWSVYGGRAIDASDASVSSRWKMLEPLKEGIASSPIIGSGFGATITYVSDDPRIIGLYPGGKITTSAIEWQYLEIWLKMGLFGLLAILWLWWRTGLLFWKTLKTARGADRLLVSAFMSSFLAFVVANIFTPYINHPLGWMYLALILAGLHAAAEDGTPDQASSAPAASG